MLVEAGKKLPYTLEVQGYLEDPHDQRLTRYETDILIFDQFDYQKWIPRLTWVNFRRTTRVLIMPFDFDDLLLKISESDMSSELRERLNSLVNAAATIQRTELMSWLHDYSNNFECEIERTSAELFLSLIHI